MSGTAGSTGDEDRVRCSWLIPVRNGGRWLAEAVASAAFDSGPADEIVVVDDGSTDGCVDTLPAWDRLRIIRRPPEGIVAALEAGRAACRGEFIARLDADDRAIPGRLACQIPRFDDPTVAAVGGRARLFVDDGDPPEGMSTYVDWVNHVPDLHRELLVESPLFHPATTFRAAAVDRVGGYRQGDLPEDYDLWLRLVRDGGRLARVDQEVLELRDHAARLTRADRRYRRQAFDRCRQEHLAATVLKAPTRVALWAGRRGGRPWIPWLREQGHDLVAIVDLASGPDRQGAPVVSPDDLTGVRWDVLLVAVGSRGARAAIRERLREAAPDRLEGRDWFAVL